MRQQYRYVGPRAIAAKHCGAPPGDPVRSASDVLRWIRTGKRMLGNSGSVIATFVVDQAGVLRIADRRSEHYACAGGGSVQSAGEICFAVHDNNVVIVVWVTNQSTGYCPEPESWPAMEAALARAGLAAPQEFSQAMVFRMCQKCGSINVVKDAIFVCDVCSAPLPTEWNCDEVVAV